MIPYLFAAAALAAANPAESSIKAPGPLAPLSGTMLMPAGTPRAVVMIVPGSGPTDRDGNSPLGVRAAPYRLLAEDLAARGVATVRIDKRGLFGSRAAAADPAAVTVADYATDVHQWAKAIRARTGASCIWVAGHSEGALIALAAAQDRSDLCGLVLISGMGRKFGEVLRAQLRANPANAPILEQAFAALDALESGRRVDAAAMNPALLPLFGPKVQGFLISLLSADPAALARHVRLPVLIVQGDKDLQVTVEDAQLLHAADPKAKLAIVPGANHVLKAVTSPDRAANLATYADPSLPLAPGIVNAVAAFVAPPRGAR
jgi:alpha-beta hydrolase superfamily lysophospholipase